MNAVLQWRSPLTVKVALAAVTIAITALLAAPGFPAAWADSWAYLAMARGVPTLMPWAARILLPDLVALGSRFFGSSIDIGFELITCIAFMLWVSIVVTKWRTSIWLPLFLVTPLIVASLRAVYITDMFHMGLTAVFLSLLSWNPPTAAIFMIIMIMGRESSMFLAFISAAVLLWNRKFATGCLMLAGYLVGSFLVHRLTVGVQNVHQMSDLLYLFTKMPANLLRNWAGVLMWTNGYAWCDHPVFVVPLPGSFHLGVITQVGFCAPSVAAPLATIASYVTTFGVLPAVLLAVLRARGVPKGQWRQEWWTTAFVYGSLMVALGSLAGEPVDREIGYGWPLFLIALPVICSEMLTWRIAVLHVIAAWAPLLLTTLLGRSGDELWFIGVSMQPLISILSLAIGLVANVVSYEIMRSILLRSQRPDATPVLAGVSYPVSLPAGQEAQ